MKKKKSFIFVNLFCGQDLILIAASTAPLVTEEMESLETDLFPKVLLGTQRSIWAKVVSPLFASVAPSAEINAAATKPSMPQTQRTPMAFITHNHWLALPSPRSDRTKLKLVQ